MLLTITTTYEPATDLGFLLHKNPALGQSFPLSFGQVHIFYPEATAARCTMALLLDVDPVALSRGQPAAGRPLAPYVNDRPYVASSFLSVAIAQTLGTALNGRSRERPELVAQPLPLEAQLAVLPCRGGEGLLRRLFEPLGYTVTATQQPLDPHFPEWGPSPYWTVTLAATCRLQALLAHLYVLVPVLDDEKHYWVGAEEVDKLLRHGEGWLAAHPERELITARALKHRGALTRDALARLTDEGAADPEERETSQAQQEAAVEAPLSLHAQRLGAVLSALRAAGASRVLDLGCGEGRLLSLLLDDPAFTEIVGLDVSYRALQIARERLRLDRLPAAQQARVRLLHGALTYRDERLRGFDGAAVVEVIEHLDPPRLAAFEQVLFGQAQPGVVVITTPNIEYNVRFPTLAAGAFRHGDHRFEWSRAEFQAWSEGVGRRFGYRVRLLPIGPDDPDVGAPSQMAIFTRGLAAGGQDDEEGGA